MAAVTTTTTQQQQQQSVVRHTQNKKVVLPGIGVQLITAGTAACIADLFTFPLDTTKVRLQVQGEGGGGVQHGRGVGGTLLHIVRSEGPRALYSGLVPGLQRQMAFSAIRIGAYDVVKVRMQAEGKVQQYKGVVDAYLTIGREEGVRNGLYRGTLPNIARNCIVNVGETVVYDAVKDGFIQSGYLSEGIACHFLSAVVAGVTATLVASPVDVVKTRFMNSPRGKYRGALHCAQVTARTEGFLAFYKGFTASCLRLVSWNIVLWLSFEQIKLAVNNHYRNQNK